MTTVKLTGAVDYDKYMAIHTLTLKKYISLAREFQKHIPYPSHEHGVIDQCKDIKQYVKQNCTNYEYTVQYRKDVQYASVKMSCGTTNFPALPFCGPHVKLYGVRGLSKHYHLQLEPKLGYGKCAIRRMPFSFVACTNMLDKPWVHGVDHAQ